MSVLFHLGNAIVDVVLAVDALPAAGGDVFARQVGEFAGGGCNVMAAAARQGMHVVYAGMHGTGPRGDLVRAALAAENVSWLQGVAAWMDTGYSISLLTPDAERTFVSVAGAEAHLTIDGLECVRPSEDDVVYLTGYSLLHPANRGALLAWLPGLISSVVVVFDPGPLVGTLPEMALDAVMTRADWVTANRAEAQALTGEDDPGRAAHVLASAEPWPAGGARSRRGRGVLVRAGADGCIVAEPGRDPVSVPSPKVRAVDLNGAGDTHTGAFIAALDRGVNPVDAAAWANRAAAWSVTRVGPATAPTLEEMTCVTGKDDAAAPEA